MKKLIFVLLAVLALASCATRSGNVPVLRHKVGQMAESLAAVLPPGARVAVMPFDAENRNLSFFLMEELSLGLGRLGIEVVDRRNLGFVFREQGVQVVNDESLQSIGNILGAEHVITGRMWNIGSERRLSATVTNMKTSQRSSVLYDDLPNDGELLIRNPPAHGTDEIEQVQPLTAGAFLDRGLLFLRLGDFETAIPAFTDALDLRPDFSQAYFWRGRAHHRMQDFDHEIVPGIDRGADFESALADYNQTIRLDPENIWAYISRSLLHQETGNFALAMGDRSQAIRLDPNNALAYVNSGTLHNAMGNHTQAIADFDKALHIDPNYAAAYYNRGFTHKAMGNHALAIADLTEAIRLNPHYAVAYNNRGAAHNAMGNHALAIADLTEAIRLDPNFAAAHINRGAAHNARGNLNRAIADFETALRIEPNNDVAKGWLAFIRRELRR